MSVLNNSLLLGAPAGGAAGYSISRSLRFNSADSAYLSRTPASQGNRKTWTWAGWVKRSRSGIRQALFAAHDGGAANYTTIEFESDQLGLFYGGTISGPRTTAVFRDPSAWMHICAVLDTTQATTSDRVKLYVNGVQQVIGSGTYPSLNADLKVNAAVPHNIGADDIYDYLSGYLADVHLVDGQALDPTSFGEFSATTGVWMPKQYTGTYGTNGFKLSFSDNSTAAALGTDSSGQGNTWTVNNLSVTAGAGNDSLVDVPTNGSEVDTGAGGQVRGNYSTWNPLIAASGLSNGNLDLLNQTSQSTIGVASGKWYCEYTIINASLNFGPSWGFSNSSSSVYAGLRARAGSSASAGGVTVTLSGHSSDITSGTIGIALNLDANECKIYHNNQLRLTATGIPVGIYFFWHSADGAIDQIKTNFGQRPFAYTAPSGFKALCTANLPAPTITNPSTVFDTKLYTSNAGTLTVSGLGFSPDFAWLKSRGTGVAHALYDTVRGAGRALKSNTTEAEQYTTDGFVSFNSDGFTLGANNNSPQPDINYTNNIARVAWVWDAGSSTVTNTQGSISSQVRANASAGFSIVTYTGTGSNATVGHGLGVGPSWIIIKNRTTSHDWIVYANESGTLKQLYLNLTLGSSGAGLSLPSSTTFNLAGGGATGSNGSGDNYVAYCFAPVAGYSAFGSYTGNGSSDGPFVYTGFRPRWVMIKITNTGTSIDHWVMWDTVRDDYNVADSYLLANNPQQEVTSSAVTIDALSNGFKLRNSSTNQNGSGSTYIYAAFAEAPFQYARAR
jgi:hypothetical protein